MKQGREEAGEGVGGWGGGGEGCGGSPGESPGQAAHVGSFKFLSVPPTSAQPVEESGEHHTPPAHPRRPPASSPYGPCPPPPPTCTLSPYFPPYTSPWAWGSVAAGPEGPGLVWDARCAGCGSWGRVIPIVPVI